MSEWKSHLTQLMNFLDKDHEDVGTQLLNELAEMLSEAEIIKKQRNELAEAIIIDETRGMSDDDWLRIIQLSEEATSSVIKVIPKEQK